MKLWFIGAFIDSPQTIDIVTVFAAVMLIAVASQWRYAGIKGKITTSAVVISITEVMLFWSICAIHMVRDLDDHRTPAIPFFITLALTVLMGGICRRQFLMGGRGYQRALDEGQR